MQIRVQRLGPGMVQQFQTRCSDCGGQGEKFRGTFVCIIIPGAYNIMCIAIILWRQEKVEHYVFFVSIPTLRYYIFNDNI